MSDINIGDKVVSFDVGLIYDKTRYDKASTVVNKYTDRDDNPGLVPNNSSGHTLVRDEEYLDLVQTDGTTFKRVPANQKIKIKNVFVNGIIVKDFKINDKNIKKIEIPGSYVPGGLGWELENTHDLIFTLSDDTRVRTREYSVTTKDYDHHGGKRRAFRKKTNRKQRKSRRRTFRRRR